MKNLWKRMITLVMSLVLLFQLGATAQAAPSRRPGNVKYLSAVALIEAKDDAEADEILTELKKEENGAFEAYIKLDLNKGGEKKVYLAYKTSTNVDDAITDLSVMNMNGDFTMGNYEKILSETMDRYVEITKDYRTMAAVFKANYEAENRNALTAYRQMNYYYVEKNGVKTYMGDYLLNFPADDIDFATILFSGNLNVVTNLKALMAMAVTGSENTLADRISAAYSNALTDASVYENAAYEESAKSLAEQLRHLKKQINLGTEKHDKIAEMDLTDEEKKILQDAEQTNIDMNQSFLELLKEIDMGETTLGDYLMDNPVLETKVLFPVIAAATEAEKLLIEYRAFYSLLLYDVLSMGEDALDEALKELEDEYEPISVYHGVQNDLAEGTIGVTGDAEFLAAATGDRFISGSDVIDPIVTGLKTAALSLVGAAGASAIVGGIAYLNIQRNALDMARDSLETALRNAQGHFDGQLTSLRLQADMYIDLANQHGEAFAKTMTPNLPNFPDMVYDAYREVEVATANLNNAQTSLSAGQMAVGGAIITLGVVVMAVSIWRIVELHNDHEPTYTDIPDNMVHVVSDSVNGDRFVNYKNVPAYYYKDGKLSTRENDLNGYAGRQWVSLYYTKNFEAGYCLTATADLIATESVRDGYTGIGLFGHSSNYNLNSHCNRNNAEAVYLAFKYSLNEKSADTDVPDVIGTSFSTGTLAIVGFAGVILGMGLMGLIVKIKKTAKTKKKAAEESKTEAPAE